MSMNKQRRTSNINNVVQYDTSGNVTIPQIQNAGVDTDKFIVSNNGTISFRTGTEVLSDIAAQGALTLTTTGSTGPATLIGNTLNIPQYSAVAVVPQSRTLTINGTAYDLSADRTWSVGTITSLTGEATSSGTGAVAVTLTNSAVIGKTLSGLTISGSAITSTDTIVGAMGKLQAQINTLTGSLIYKGSWNANTNTPTITSSVGVSGNFYIVTTSGSTTINGISSWSVGDWIIFNGSIWEKVPNTNTVLSVNAKTGVVVLSTDDISESGTPTNLWFTNARAQAAITGGASTIVTTNLTVSRALVSNASGKVAVSAVTSTELGYVSGVTSAIQTQLDGKEPTISAAASDPTFKYWRGDKTWQTLPVYTFNSLSPMTTLGDTIYGGASGAGTRLAGNTTTTKKFLRQIGTGTVSAAPAWDTLVSEDIPNNAANTSGNANTATTLATARAINGVNFDGSAGITITANTPNSVTFNNAGTGDASGTTFNGSAARTISYNTIGAQPAFGNQTANYVYAGPTTGVAAAPTFRALVSADIPALAYLSNSTSSTQDGYFGNVNLYDDTTPSHYLTVTNSANLTAARILSIDVNDASRTISLSGNLTVSAAASVSGTNTGDQTDISGNAATATALKTARNINGTSFDGTAAITTSSWGTSRTITIGSTGKAVDGSGNVSWTLAEIGAQAAGSYQPAGSYVTIGGTETITGTKTFQPGGGYKTSFASSANGSAQGVMVWVNGNTSKSWDLEVLSNGTWNLNESNVSARLQLYAGGGGRIFGNLTADAFFESSDIRYKNILHTNPNISIDIDLIKFNRTDVDTDRIRYGYSAQQVKELMPELVSGDDKLSVNYMDIHSIKIAALEREVKELKAKLYGLE